MLKAEIVRYGSPITREKLGEVVHAPMWYHKRGLMQTATGYSRKLVTEYKVVHNGRLKRIYCHQMGNSGTLYIMHGKERLIIELERCG